MMAYSRWSNSRWYTYWEQCDTAQFKFPTQKLKNCQTFTILDLPGTKITYGELIEKGIYKVLQEVEDSYFGEYITDEEMFELKEYILDFMIDVDKHFKWYNFFRYEWYYPIRNKIIWKLSKNY